MAKLGIKIVATEEDTEQRGDFENLPDGVYRVQVESADVAETDPDTPQHKVTVKTVVEIIEPADYERRKIWVNYNLQHPNTQAQEIGDRQFKCLLRAMEYTELPDDDTDNLLFRSFTVSIGMGKDSKEKNADGSPKYAARNEIKRYWYPDQNNTPEIGVKATPAANDNRQPAANDNSPAQAAAAGGQRRPWGSK